MANTMSISDYKALIANTFRAILAKGDEKFAAYKAERDAEVQSVRDGFLAQIQSLTARAESAEKAQAEMSVAYATANQQLIDAKTIAAQEVMTELKKATVEAAAEFGVVEPAPVNSTPMADAAVEVIVQEPAIDTTVVEEMPGVKAVGETAATPAPVVEAAIEAVVNVVDEVVPAEAA